MELLIGALLLIYQSDFISSSECNVVNCDPNHCNGVVCSQCLPGYYYYLHNNNQYCRKCYLGCHSCNGGQCFNCYYSECVNYTDINNYANCDKAGCSENPVVMCSGCPDGFYLDKRCYRCDNINCKCKTASGCDECLPGYHDTNTLCTECVSGKYGDSCELNCISTCANGTCDKESGTCLTQCTSYQYMDDSGECKPCPGTETSRCSSCVNSTYCTKCKQRWYWNPTCQYDCTGCISKCNRNDGCSGGCGEAVYYNTYNPGKKGYECIRCFSQCSACLNDTHCTSCKDNFWGTNCLYSCNNCDGTCDKDKGCIDSCELGYYKEEVEDGYECKPCPEHCDQCLDALTCKVCEDGLYVDEITKNCISCSINCTDIKCDTSNGTCTRGCSLGSTGRQCNEQCPNSCIECDQFNASNCKSCDSEFNGDSCEYSCSKNCKSSDGVRECVKENGACVHGCEDKYWTKTCTEACPDGCTNQNCNETNGECLHGCASGYYGANCSLKCPDTCSDGGCFQANGTCKSACIPGSGDSQCGTVTSTQTMQRNTDSATEGQTDNVGSIAVPAGAGAGAAVVIIVVIVVVILLIKRRRRAAEKESHGEISLEDHNPSLAIANSAYTTINDAKPGPSAGDDAVILNEKSPIIMSRTPDDINVDTHQTTNNPADSAISIKHKGSKKPTDVPIKSIQQQSSEGVSKENPDSLTQVQRPLLGKHTDTNARAFGETKLTESDTYENKNKEHTGDVANIPDGQSESQTENDQILNQSNGDPEEGDNTYYNTIGKRVTISKLADYVNAKSYEDIENEFEKIHRGLLKPYSVAKASRNADKNRYRMIYPFFVCRFRDDENRVKLNDGGNDYVNASYIEGFNKQKEYIAAAGPFARKDKKSTTTDFWRMIWQEKCETIVMLTKCYENEEHKCDQYWPDLGENKHYGKLNVTCVTEDQYADFTVRSFVVTQDDMSLNIRQIHFTAWPDKGVPVDVTSMIEYRQKVRSIHENKETPMLVHCSAGIGRTGTFIALDIQTFVGESRGYVDIFGCVRTLRQQRINMVQTPEQYEYLHLAVLHALTFDCKSIPAEEFITNYSRIVKSKDGSSEIEQQFKNLTSTLDVLSEEDSDEIIRNTTLKDKNRDGADIPGDENRVRLSQDWKPGSSDYINAIYINGYKTCNRLIVAQTPLPTTIVDFLSMIYQTNCSCVVSMEKPDLQDNTVGVFWPADNQVMKHGTFQVKCKESKTCENHSVKKLSIVRNSGKKEELKEVNLFIFTSWPTDASVPKTSDSLIQLIKTVDKVNNSHDEGEENPIIVHCMTGATRSCLYCAVSVLIEKMEIEHEVSVVNTLVQIKSRRRSAFPTLEQYKFCHQSVINYLQTFDTYSNFDLTKQSDTMGSGAKSFTDAVYATVKK